MNHLQLVILRAPIRVRGHDIFKQYTVELRHGRRTFRTIFEAPITANKPSADAVIASVLLTHAHRRTFSDWCERTQCTDSTLFAERQRTGAALRVFLGEELFTKLSRRFELQPVGEFSPAQYIDTRLS